MNKKFIAKLLIFCLVFTMLPVSAFATPITGTQGDANNGYTVTFDTTNAAVDAGQLSLQTGKEATVTVAAQKSSNETYKVTLDTVSSDDTAIATVTKDAVNSTVTVTGVAAGATTITVEGKVGDNTVKATFGVKVSDEEQFTVTFNSNDGSAVPTQTVAKGGKVEKPADPTREGYTFGGWYTDQTFAEEFDFTAPINTNTTVYAKWIEDTAEGDKVTVTFNSNGGSVDTTKIVTKGSKVEKPADPTQAGYTFGGWYTDAECTQPFDFETAITANITLYAKWNKVAIGGNTFIVTLDPNGGALATGTSDKVNVDLDGYVTSFPEPTRDKYVFLGWFTATTGGTQVTTQTRIEDNMTVYAQWAEELTVTFDVNGGNGENLVVKVGKGYTVEQPATPTHGTTGMIFDGWYTAKDGGNRFDFTNKINANTTLYAHWNTVAEGAVVKFDLNGGTTATAIADVEVDPATGHIVWPTVKPTKANASFKGWSLTKDGALLNDDATFTQTTTVYAVWVDQITIKFDYNFDTTDTTITAPKDVVIDKGGILGDALSVMPSYVERKGYVPEGWFTAKNGGERVALDTKLEQSCTLYVQWTKVVIDRVAIRPEISGWEAGISGTTITVTGRLEENEIAHIYGNFNVNKVTGSFDDGSEEMFTITYNNGKFEVAANTQNGYKIEAGKTEGTYTMTLDDLIDAYTIDITGVKKPLEATVAESKPEVDEPKPEGIAETEQQLGVFKALTANDAPAIGNLNDVVNNPNLVDETEAGIVITAPSGSKQEVKASDIDQAKKDLAAELKVDAEELKTVIMPIWKISLVSQKAAAADFKPLRLTFDIEPQISVIVATADAARQAQYDSSALTDKNSILVKTCPVKVEQEVMITLPLGEAFAKALDNGRKNENKTIVILHENDFKNPISHFYLDAVNDFTMQFYANGFSEYTIDGDFQKVAEINGTPYQSLQDALDAVVDDQTITVYGDKQLQGVVHKAKRFTIVKAAGSTATVEITLDNGLEFAQKPTAQSGIGTYVITGTVTSNGGGGGGGGSSSNVTIAKNITGGTVSVSPSNPRSGQTVTINVKPSTGYVLDTLTVTDKNGEKVELTKVDDNKYTFVMPNGKVTITPSFKQTETTTDKTTTGLTFSDVKSDAWYAEYIAYVVEKGMMNGYEDGRFGPNDSTTRAQIVTVLYRLEGEPATSSASFRDVSGGQYYSNAVAWAANNGIVNGYETGKFGPSDNVTREQIAAILYRYAQYKEYDVTATGNINNFSDSANVSSWAVDALNWAIGEGLINGDNGALRPQGNATRAEIATLLTRFCENIAK